MVETVVGEASGVPDLDPLFEPASVAVVGASPDSWYSSRLIDNHLDYGFDGDLFLVNPGRDEAWSRPCYDSIDAVPETVDLAVVSVPREAAVDAVREAGERGVPAALVITAGFAEADDRGRELQDELAAIADVTDIRICGPNCIGLANARAGTVLTSTCSRPPEPGSVGLVSQSGALAFTTFYERGADEDVRFSHVVSTGNEADLSATDYVAHLARDPETAVIGVYLEGLADPRRFVRVAAEAVSSGTPVLAVKVGRSADAEAAARSHTASVTGNDAVWDAALADAGVERVPDIPDLLARASVHAAAEPPASARTCVLSTSGGLASLLADLAADRGLDLPPLSDGAERELLEMDDLLTFESVSNPADIRGYGAAVLPEIAEVVFAEDRFDAYVIAVALSAVDDDAEEIADDLLTVAEMADAPVLVLWTGRRTSADGQGRRPYERVREEVPLFYDPARCLDALASLVRYGEARDRARVPPIPQSPPEGERPSGATLSWTEATELLSAFGIEPVETRVVGDPEAAGRAAEAVGFPAVVKIDSRDVPHRDRVGGVALGIESPEAARSAADRIRSRVADARPEASIDGLLVQPQVPAGIEAIVGASRDPGFGPVATVGSGGTLVEIMDDRAIRLAPLNRAAALAAIDETTLGDRLTEAGRDALADLVVRAGELIAERPVAALDLNPVVIRDGEAAVVDVLVRSDAP